VGTIKKKKKKKEKRRKESRVFALSSLLTLFDDNLCFRVSFAAPRCRAFSAQLGNAAHASLTMAHPPSFISTLFSFFLFFNSCIGFHYLFIYYWQRYPALLGAIRKRIKNRVQMVSFLINCGKIDKALKNIWYFLETLPTSSTTFCSNFSSVTDAEHLFKKRKLSKKKTKMAVIFKKSQKILKQLQNFWYF